jgi:hypothetical protein
MDAVVSNPLARWRLIIAIMYKELITILHHPYHLVSLLMPLFVSGIFLFLNQGFKEAQSSLAPVMVVAIFVAMAAAFVPPLGDSLAFLLPVYGTSAVVSVLTVGGIVPANAVLFSVVGNLLATAVGVILALQLFNRERLLYSM